ncbi:MAG: hypothetical protein ACYDB0_01070 [Acidithiobacillus sp.]
MLPDIDSTLTNISKVTLPGGVVGKVTLGVIIASLCMGGIALTSHNIWLSAGALTLIFLLAATMFWRLISFADRHPQAALLEGAQFLAHEQMQQATKGQPAFIVEPTDRTQPFAVEGPDANLQIALNPDSDIQDEQNNTGRDNH